MKVIALGHFIEAIAFCELSGRVFNLAIVRLGHSVVIISFGMLG